MLRLRARVECALRWRAPGRLPQVPQHEHPPHEPWQEARLRQETAARPTVYGRILEAQPLEALGADR